MNSLKLRKKKKNSVLSDGDLFSVVGIYRGRESTKGKTKKVV